VSLGVVVMLNKGVMMSLFMVVLMMYMWFLVCVSRIVRLV